MKILSDNKILKILIGVLILMLVLAILGASDAYGLLRWCVLLVTILFSVTAFMTRRYYWGCVFILFAILFNPIHALRLTKTEWIFADYSLVITLCMWAFDYFRSYHKGHLFERFVEQKFPKTEWNVVTYTRDSHKRLKRFVETDGNPDFVFRKIANNYAVAVECKYRSRYWNNITLGEGIGWEKKLSERYGEYSRKENIPVYIAIGVGGNPKTPTAVSFVPLEIIQNKYPTFIPKEVIEKYQNIPPV